MSASDTFKISLREVKDRLSHETRRPINAVGDVSKTMAVVVQGIEPAVSAEAVEEALQRMHRQLSGGACREYIAYVKGAIRMANVLGLLDGHQVIWWERRLDVCPGHEGGQSWCAYCGDICRFCDGPVPCRESDCLAMVQDDVGGTGWIDACNYLPDRPRFVFARLRNGMTCGLVFLGDVDGKPEYRDGFGNGVSGVDVVAWKIQCDPTEDFPVHHTPVLCHAKNGRVVRALLRPDGYWYPTHDSGYPADEKLYADGMAFWTYEGSP